MSIWTHVAATIRFDAILGLAAMKPDLGVTVSFSDPTSKWDACTVPCGSEGSLQHNLWVNPERSSMAAYTATIWGDLRDYDDAGAVVAYLTRITEGKMVRQGVATIEVEGAEPLVLRFDTDAQNWLPALSPASVS